MPLLAIPLLLLLVLLMVLIMMPVSLLMRYRRGTARRQARGWLSTLNVATIALSACLFLTTAAITNIWVPRAFVYSLLGLLAGGILGLVGVWLSRWEATPQGLHYTPNRWLVLTILLVVLARILYGFWRAWHAWHVRPDDMSWLAAAGAAGSLAVGATVLGYYLAYWIGVRRRVRRFERDRIDTSLPRGEQPMWRRSSR